MKCSLIQTYIVGLAQKGKDEDGIRGFMASDIKSEIRRGARLKCHYCRKNVNK